MMENKLLKEEKNKRKKEKKVDQLQTKSMLAIPYVKGVTEALQKNFQNTRGGNISEATQELEQARGAPQWQMSKQGLSGSRIFHLLQRLSYGAYR